MPETLKPSGLTEAQERWLGENPPYELVGPPRDGVRFISCGTLYADGRFGRMEPMKPIRLEPGCRLVGKRV